MPKKCVGVELIAMFNPGVIPSTSARLVEPIVARAKPANVRSDSQHPDGLKAKALGFAENFSLLSTLSN